MYSARRSITEMETRDVPNRGQRTRLVLEGVEPLSPLGHLSNVVPHDSDGRVNFLLDCLGLAPARAAAAG